MIRYFVVLLLAVSALAADSSLVVRDIQLSGNFRTKDWVIRRELHFEIGDSVSTEDLDAARKRILSLQIFNNADVTADSLGTVNVKVSEQLFILPVAGLSATDGKLQDALEHTDKFFDIVTITGGVADLNVLGSGARATVTAQFGAADGFSARYRSRWLAPGLPIAFDAGFSTLRVSDKHFAVNGDTVRNRDRQFYLDVGSRKGKFVRGGLILRHQYLREDVDNTDDGRIFDTKWVTPYGEIDSRDLEWYPSKGIFARAAMDVATGTEDFVRSQADVRGYFTVIPSKVPSVFAWRLSGGTSTSSTPLFAHYYFGFSSWFRGYSAVKSEAATYLQSNAEFRIPLTRETTYNIPVLGRYGKNIPFWFGVELLGQRGQIQLNGEREDTWAGGLGLLFRAPLIDLLEIGICRNRDNDLDIVIAAGVWF